MPKIQLRMISVNKNIYFLILSFLIFSQLLPASELKLESTNSAYDAILDYYIDDTNKSIEDIRKISDKFVSSNKKVDVVCFIIEFKG